MAGLLSVCTWCVCSRLEQCPADFGILQETVLSTGCRSFIMAEETGVVQRFMAVSSFFRDHPKPLIAILHFL
jgi:hypothetical protein